MTPTAGDLIVSVSGVRGVIGQSLTPEVACRFAAALGSDLQALRRRGEEPARALVGRDGRPSGEMLRLAVSAGLMSVGCTVLDLGIVPTPTVGVAVRHLGAAGAIQITASHNPAPWNGLKLFGPDGAVLTAARGVQVAAAFRANSAALAPWDRLGRETGPADAATPHLDAVLAQLDARPIKAAKFRAFVDGNGGAGGPLARQLLARLGCETVEHHCEPDGRFAHDPEPTPASLAGVAPLIPRNKCHVGFALDPDADRLALIDEKGNCVSEELTLALAVRFALRERKGPVVVNMSTSRTIGELAAEAGVPFFRSAVGEANVVEAMRLHNAAIGGEGNGGVIDPRVGWVRDPFVGMALILGLMAAERKPLSALVEALPRFAMLKVKFAVELAGLPAAFERLATLWPGVAVNRLDGLRLDGPDWWLHVRPSNTEPVVRVIAEATTAGHAEQLCAEAAAVIRG